MAKKKTDKGATPKAPSTNKIKAFFTNESVRFVIGFAFASFALYLLLAFTSFLFTGAADQSVLENATAEQLASVDNKVSNYAGSRGAQVANYLINRCFGFASIFLPIFLLAAALKMMKLRRFRLWKWFICCSSLLIWFSIFLGFAFVDHYKETSIYWGGLHGFNVSNWLVSQIGVPGVWLLLLITALSFFVYVSSQTIIWLRKILSLSYLKREKKEKPVTDNGEEIISSYQPEAVEPSHTSVIDLDINKPTHTRMDVVVPEEEEDYTPPTEEEDDNNGIDIEIESEISEEDDYREGGTLEPYNPKLDLENYRFPTLDLLTRYDSGEPTVDMNEQNANKDKIINTLRSFGIEISSIKATVGPTVTLYEITPEQGVRISKIRGLEDDIALSLSALGIRIIAPIPGKGTIGIEVPNSHPKTVSMHSVIGSKRFQEGTFELPMALGKTISNEVFMVDLAKMPHVLVAGATGQGKSVGLNAIITSLLYKKHPAELKFVLIDPKKVEFSVYADIENHFLAKLPDGEDAIITDVTKVVHTLNSLCIEMDSRYDLLKKAHVRNVKEYNEKFINRRLNPEKGHRFMPYIVVIIDEFGDLIMTAGKEVELPIARIAQLARAVGIHMIIATQRPTTNIITGTIKANFPARIAFRVTSMIDSRTILDRPGANQLIGRGDLLFLQGADPVRVQCAFVDTPEVEKISSFIAKQQSYPTAFYLPEYVAPDSGNDLGDVDMGRLDPLFEDAARLIVIHQQGSTSLIQRKFAIGYNRAGRIMDQIEKAGIVGPSEGSKARQVLCLDENDLEMRLNNL
ncbi:DNA translocase FtsK [Bacteroides sp. 214]|uniref:FtsK/SpoIIIE family DNA translocase n=1 Tax=Bacteroides sp. 214 TaxID=2302935 RepID=UPI0013D82EAE|nr:DNA translocase FtsK [Bacteroides sp. 214]NDW13238.1 DNA translocase FtsK [Bacteroides sp. 214]